MDPRKKNTITIMCVVGFPVLLAGLFCLFKAIWTAGPDAGRWGGTAATLLIIDGLWFGVMGIIADTQ